MRAPFDAWSLVLIVSRGKRARSTLRPAIAPDRKTPAFPLSIQFAQLWKKEARVPQRETSPRGSWKASGVSANGSKLLKAFKGAVQKEKRHTTRPFQAQLQVPAQKDSCLQECNRAQCLWKHFDRVSVPRIFSHALLELPTLKEWSNWLFWTCQTTLSIVSPRVYHWLCRKYMRHTIGSSTVLSHPVSVPSVNLSFLI